MPCANALEHREASFIYPSRGAWLEITNFTVMGQTAVRDAAHVCRSIRCGMQQTLPCQTHMSAQDSCSRELRGLRGASQPDQTRMSTWNTSCGLATVHTRRMRFCEELHGLIRRA